MKKGEIELLDVRPLTDRQYREFHHREARYRAAKRAAAQAGVPFDNSSLPPRKIAVIRDGGANEFVLYFIT